MKTIRFNIADVNEKYMELELVQEEEPMTERQQFIARHEAELKLKRHNLYVKTVEKQLLRREMQVLKNKKKEGY